MSFVTRTIVGQARSRAIKQLPLSSTWGLRHESSVAAGLATPASGSISGETKPATHYRITLRRSGIGLPEKTNRTLMAMGLKKRLQSIYRPIGPDVAGSILAVKELVHVENVRRLEEDEETPLDDIDAIWVNEAGELVDPGSAAKKAPRGYRIVGNVVSEERDQEIKRGRLT